MARRARLDELEAKEAQLQQQLDHFAAEPPTELDVARLRSALKRRLGELDGLLETDGPRARQTLRELLDGPITLEVGAAGGHVLRGRTRVGAPFEQGYIQMVPRKGFEPPQCCHR